MCNDPEVYQNPETFNVERFLGDNPEADPGLVVFGFGRRVCPGRLLADASLYITFAMILWSFDVSPIKVDGKPVPPVYSPISGLVRLVIDNGIALAVSLTVFTTAVLILSTFVSSLGLTPLLAWSRRRRTRETFYWSSQDHNLAGAYLLFTSAMYSNWELGMPFKLKAYTEVLFGELLRSAFTVQYTSFYLKRM